MITYVKKKLMKKQINDLLLKMQTGENCIGETANKILDLYNVSITLSNKDAEFIYSLLPDWVKNKAPEGLDPTMYGTLSKEGDDEIQERVKQILGNVC